MPRLLAYEPSFQSRCLNFPTHAHRNGEYFKGAVTNPHSGRWADEHRPSFSEYLCPGLCCWSALRPVGSSISPTSELDCDGIRVRGCKGGPGLVEVLSLWAAENASHI